MKILSDTDVRARLPWKQLIAAIEEKLRQGDCTAPARMNCDLEGGPDRGGGSLLLMPAWQRDEIIGLKTVTFWPGNRDRGEHTHSANYILMDARQGTILAILDGAELTARRTAAVSALAAQALLRRDAERLLVIGTGPIATNLARAHHAIHDFTHVEIYGRNQDAAARIAAELREEGVPCSVCSALEDGVAQADMISAATTATSPIFNGNLVRPGTHIDLVGSFKRGMREVDDALVARAASIWVDTKVAVTESGDLLIPIENGVIPPDRVKGDLRTLLLSEGGRQDMSDITIFKAVGFAIPDLAAAQAALLYEVGSLVPSAGLASAVSEATD